MKQKLNALSYEASYFLSTVGNILLYHDGHSITRQPLVMFEQNHTEDHSITLLYQNYWPIIVIKLRCHFLSFLKILDRTL